MTEVGGMEAEARKEVSAAESAEVPPTTHPRAAAPKYAWDRPSLFQLSVHHVFLCPARDQPPQGQRVLVWPPGQPGWAGTVHRFDRPGHACVQGTQVLGMTPYLCGPRIYNLSLTMRKMPDKFKLRNIIQNTWKLCLKTVKVIKNKESQKLLPPRFD